MPNQPRTPNRVIRVDDELWAEYGQACAADGTDRSSDLREHMQRRIRAWRRRQRAQGNVGDHEDG